MKLFSGCYLMVCIGNRCFFVSIIYFFFFRFSRVIEWLLVIEYIYGRILDYISREEKIKISNFFFKIVFESRLIKGKKLRDNIF